ncbi:MAG: helix-turn-helix domain-containing protein, partial [Rikenellaceae bacterium]
MQFPERTFENLPLMVELMFNKIVELEAKIEALTPPKEERTTIDTDAAVALTQKTKSTIYKLVRTGKIPAYKRGKKL